MQPAAIVAMQPCRESADTRWAGAIAGCGGTLATSGQLRRAGVLQCKSRAGPSTNRPHGVVVHVVV
jgi:hypothetical protein